jgi:circadian clock protein KaiB
VSGSSTSSIRAVANLRRLLRGYRDGQVAVSIRDLALDPAAGEHDQIAFTPTLCKNAPGPPMRILGDLSNPQPLVELLEFYGVDRKDGHP